MTEGDKPRLAVALLNDYAARDFVDSGVLRDLAGEFRLVFITTPRLTIDLSSYGVVAAQHRMGWIRCRLYLLTAGLWHMTVKRRFELNRRNVLHHATFGVGPLIRSLISGLSLVGVSRPLGGLLRGWLRLTASRLLPRDRAVAAVLVYTSVRSYFADDIVRDARRLGVPVLALTNNWDNLNTKSFLEAPSYLGVWGEQGFLIARLMHGIPPHRIFVIGSPRFEIYRRFRPTRTEARNRLNFPLDRRIILFCGAGVPFEEVSLIEDLERAIEKGDLPNDLLVVYKAHPLRFARKSEKPFNPHEFRHVVLAPETERQLTDLELYPSLLAAADAIISPFSTMVMEGARHGIPAMCLGYDDPGHANHDWGRSAFNLHLYMIRHSDWAVVCESRAAFRSSCERLIAMVGDRALATQALAAAEMVWKTGQDSVAERIARAIRTIAAGRDADKSFEVAQEASRTAAQSPVDFMAVSKE